MNNSWKQLALIRWQHLQPTIMNIKNWYNFIKERSLVYDKAKPQDLFVAPIENCGLLNHDSSVWEFKCPKSYTDLDKVEATSDQRHCSTCNKIVYLVTNEEDYISHIEHGDCIAYYETINEKKNPQYLQ